LIDWLVNCLVVFYWLLVGWFVGWLVGLLVGWLVGRLDGLLVGWILVGW